MNSIALCYFLFFKQMYVKQEIKGIIFHYEYARKNNAKDKNKRNRNIYFEYLMNYVEQLLNL